MLRLVITAIISFLISFGAISKSQEVSSLLNHMNQDHVSHSHDTHETHEHDHKHSERTNKTENDHSHHFDLSLLTQIFTFDNYQTDALSCPLTISDVLTPFANTTLFLFRYSFSIFRPPIA